MQIVKGVSSPPGRIVVFGPPGVGKSTFACGAPKVLALDYEAGLDQIGPARVKGADSWDESLKLVRQACTGEGDWKTIVVDTADRIEAQATLHVCKVGLSGKSMPDLAAFGYGKGEVALLAKWREFLFELEAARAKGREVILVCHVVSKVHDDPQLGSYSKWIAALQVKCWSVTHQWADACLFAQHEQGLVDGRAVMTGNRVLRTEQGSGFDAKNRWHLPATLPLSWEAFAKARAQGSRPAGEIAAAVRELAKGTPYAGKAEEFIAQAPEDVGHLLATERSLTSKIAQDKATKAATQPAAAS